MSAECISVSQGEDAQGELCAMSGTSTQLPELNEGEFFRLRNLDPFSVMENREVGLSTIESLSKFPATMFIACPRILLVKAAAEYALCRYSACLKSTRIVLNLLGSQPDGVLEPDALFVQSRALIALSRIEEAQIVVEKLMQLDGASKEHDLPTMLMRIALGRGDMDLAVSASCQDDGSDDLFSLVKQWRIGTVAMETSANYHMVIQILIELYETAAYQEDESSVEALCEAGLLLSHCYQMRGHVELSRSVLAPIKFAAETTHPVQLRLHDAQEAILIGQFELACDILGAPKSLVEPGACLGQRVPIDWLRSLAQHVSGRKRDALISATRVFDNTQAVNAYNYQARARLLLASTYFAVGDVEHARQCLSPCKLENLTQGTEKVFVVALNGLLLERKEGLKAAQKYFQTNQNILFDENMVFMLGCLCIVHDRLFGLIITSIGVDLLPQPLIDMLDTPMTRHIISLASKAAGKDGSTALRQRCSTSRVFDEHVNIDVNSPYEILLFGNLKIVCNGEPLNLDRWSKSKARQMFLRIALEKGCDVSRETIVELLWPNMDPSCAANNFYVTWNQLQNTLRRANRATKVPLPVISNGRRLALNSEVCRTDLERFNTCLDLARQATIVNDVREALVLYHRLALIYKGNLLPGDENFSWLEPYRDRYRKSFVNAMLAAATLCLEGNMPEEAQSFIDQALRIDRCRESAYETSIRAYRLMGRRDEALSMYYECAKYLEETLGLDPSPEMQKLYRDLIDG